MSTSGFREYLRSHLVGWLVDESIGAVTGVHTEGNKRTGRAVTHFVPQANGYDPEIYLPPDDARISDYLLLAARGDNVEQEIIGVMTSNAEVLRTDQETSVTSSQRGFGFGSGTLMLSDP